MQIFGPLSHHAGLSVRTTGRGPRLVLVHGGSGSRTHWSRNVQALARRFTVMTPDLPGFGESARPPEGLPIDDYLDWVAQAIRLAVDEQPFHLAGFSFGGAVSAAVAARLSAQGHSPSRLTLVSPSGFGRPAGRTIRLEKIRSESASPQEIREATARNLGRWMLAREPAADDPAVDIHMENVSRASFDSRPVSYQDSLIGNLRRVDIPVQILLGERDPLIFPSLAEREALLRASLPGAAIGTIDGAGHWLQYEADVAVNTRIHQFHLQETS